MAFNGTGVGTIAYATGATGFGQALSLVGTGNVTLSGVTSSSSATGQTVEGRFKSSDASGGPLVIVSGGGWYIGLASGKIRFAWNSLTASFDTTASLNDNAWHSFAMVWTTSSTINCFIDGILVNSGTASGAMVSIPINSIGSYNGSTSFRFNGLIDEVRWSTVALYSANYTPASASFGNSLPDQTALWHFENDLLDSKTTYASVTPGAVGIVTKGLTSLAVSTPVATGGTAPYTYQFQRAPDVAGVAGTYVNFGTATSATSKTDTGLTQGTFYWYRVSVTDNLGSTVAGTGTKLSTKSVNAYYIGFIGDSITSGYNLTAGQEPPSNVQRILSIYGGVTKEVNIVNSGVVASQTSGWVNGSANYNTAIAAFASAGVDYVNIMLGTNDSSTDVTQATYLSNLTSLVNGLVALGYKVILCYSIYANDGRSAPRQALLVSYQTSINSLINGSTVFAGDIYSYSIFQTNAALYGNNLTGSFFQADGLHANPSGAQVLGHLWMRRIGAITGIVNEGQNSVGS